MVLIGSEEETMAMGPERSKPLHNFMLPCLKWGSQRYLRCMKVPSDDAGDRRSPAPVTGKKRQLEAASAAAAASDAARGWEKRMRIAVAARPPLVQGIHGGDDGGIDAVREKLMLDLKTETDRMKDAILRKEIAVAEAEEEDGDDVAAKEAKVELAPPVVLAAAVEVRPWNLRTRRAACKAPALVVGGGASGKGMLRIEEKRPNSSPLRTTGAGGGGGATVLKSPKLRGSPEKKEKVKFSLPLTRKEVEEDFFELVGHRPPRRPKKRPRNVQKQLDTLFPGLWLSEITADSYKVPEEETGKRLHSDLATLKGGTCWYS